ncbi:MobP3 family relaxase [Amedibacillus sp. YH-ame10]
MPRIIVKTNYMKSKTHKEYYVKYIATRDGVEKMQMSHGDKPATPKQRELIKHLLDDYPDTKAIFEYDDYKKEFNRENASELISAIVDQNIHDVATKENYVDYIANRPHVERLGEHGLFSDTGKSIVLIDVVEEVGKHEGNVWTHIISLKREDAIRLGFDYAIGWMNLCRAKRNELAEAMRISPNNLRWYAAFHNEGHHPHIHMIAYSIDPREGYVTQEGIAKIRHMFASDIFHQDLIQIYEGQTETRDELKKYSKDIISKLLNEINDKRFYDNQIIFNKIWKLKESLDNYHGRLMFAYLPAGIKQIVNEIVDELEKDSRIQQLYDQWKLYKQDVHQTYAKSIVEELPLHQQKEFNSIRNMIIKEVSDCNLSQRNNDVDESQMDISVDNIVVDYAIPECEALVENTKEVHSKQYHMKWSDNYKAGVAFFYGNEVVEQNMEEAESLFKSECVNGNILAMEMMGKLLELEEREGEIDDYYKNALEGALEIVKTDESDFTQNYLHYKIGRFYFYGKGCEQDYEQALTEFEMSHSQYAMYSLGTMYQRGLGVEQSDKKAYQYFLQSAQKGNAFANYEVGHYLEQGIATSKNIEEANTYYKKAYHSFLSMLKKQKDDHLLYRVGMMTYYGKGTEANHELAKSYLKDSLAFHNEHAKRLLARIYLEEDDFSHIADAIEWLKEADDPSSWYILAKEYQKGIHVEYDIKRAILYYTKCAKENNSFAMYQLAKIYLSEEYMNVTKALDFLHTAANLGNEYAQVKLGSVYMKGELLDKDVDKALFYLKKSEEQNNMFAQYQLGKLFLFGIDVEEDKEKAIEYLMKSANQGNEYAMYLLEHMNDPYYQQPLSLLASRMFHHISKIFENQLPHNNHVLGGVDRKLAQKLRQKKVAQGHNPKDHELNVK